MQLQKIVAITAADGSSHKVVQERHPSRTYGGQFVILFTAAMKQAARHITSSITLRLLFELPDHLNFTDFRQIRTQGLADILSTHPGNISRSMASLVELGIVEREGKGPRTAWRFSSDWGWNGSADQYHAFRAGRLRGKRPPGAHDQKSHNAYYGNSRCREDAEQPRDGAGRARPGGFIGFDVVHRLLHAARLRSFVGQV